MSVQHLPWSAFPPTRAMDGAMIRDALGGVIGEAATLEEAELIVRAVNCHDELVEALKQAIEAVEIFHGPGWETYRDHAPEMKRWGAAITKAEGRAE